MTSTLTPAAGSGAPSGAYHDGSERRQQETDVWVLNNINSCSDWAHNAGTYRNVTAVDQYLQHRVVLVRIHGGQVVQGGGDRSVNPLSEFTGQMFGVTLLKLSLQDVWKELQTNKRKVQSHSSR